MTGSEYSALSRCSLEDLRSLANLQLARAARLLGYPLDAQIHMDLAEQADDPMRRRSHYIAAFREARFEIEQAPNANGFFTEILLPKDIKNALEALRGSYEVVNQTAKGRPGWDAHYQDFLQFYEKNKDPGWLNSTQATMDHIRERAQRLEEWKKQLASDGVKVLEPEKKEVSNPVKETIDSATLALLLGLGAVLLFKSGK